ncbi:hypothetical protein [Candidatus Nitrospira bockiana]
MKPHTLVALVFLSLAVPTLAIANPAMLPKHPGYPSQGDFANDTGQRNFTAEQSLAKAAIAEDSHSMQSLREENNDRVLKSQGAGRLPTVQGPDIKIEPPVTEATRMPK